MGFDKAYGAYEAIMLGVDLEEAGRNFYNRVAGSCGDFRVKELFKQLAEAGMEHKRVIREEIETIFAPEWYRDEDQQMMLEYLHTVQKQPVFPDPDDSPACDMVASDPEQALEVGIRAEKQAVDYYTFLKDATQDRKGKEIFERLRQEKVKYLDQLEEMKKEL
jgi:rubrerythrin